MMSPGTTVAFPRDLAEEVADAALAKEHEDEWVVLKKTVQWNMVLKE